ncbi:hypothetical protein [Paenirhodobacter enshiensis]|uniref:hypothetical protein n=1 Tax=Paenirhodobacter enshiensis TaxID=1105367 RepID=UPI0035B20B9F
MGKPMNRTEFERIGSGIWGGHGWKSEAASAFEVDRKTISRWIAADSVPDWAATRLRAMSSIAPPPDTTVDDDRDDACTDAMEGELSRVLELALDAGWHRAEVQAAILSLTVSDMLATAGADATVSTLMQAISAIRSA